MVRRKPIHAWQYQLNEQTLGPVAQDTLIEMISAGTISATTSVWRQGLQTWQAAKDTELSKYFDEKGNASDLVNTEIEKPQRNRTAQAPKPMGETQSVLGYLKWLRISLTCYVVVTGATILTDANLLYFFSQISNGVYAQNTIAAEQAGLLVDQISAVAYIAYLLTLISSALAYGFFFQRAATNLHAMHAQHVTAKPFGLWAWYFVPIANLWKPQEGFNQVRDGSFKTAGHPIPSSNIAGIWWLTWIFGSICGSISSRIIRGQTDIDTLTLGVIFSICSSVLLFVAAYLLFRMVGQLGPIHEEARLYGASSVFD